MLYTLEFLGVDTDETFSVLTPVKNEFGKYGTILKSDYYMDIDNFIMGVLLMADLDGIYCIGAIINSKNEVKIFEQAGETEFEWYEYENLKAIETFISDCSPDAVAIIQQVDDGEYRIVHDTIYELDKIIRIKDGEIKDES